MIYFPKLKFSYLPSICRQCGREKYWIKNKSKDNSMENAECRGSGSSFHHDLFVTCFPDPSEQTWLSRLVLCSQIQSLRKSPSAQDSCFMFQLLSRSWKASTFNQEPSMTLSVAKLLGFWRKPPFLAYSPLCSWSSWPLQTWLERNLKNAGQDEDHFAALPWILSSWPGTSDSLGGSAS